MPSPDRIPQALAAAFRDHPEATDAPVVIGVSGGIDSMVLVHALAQHGVRGVIVHVNYGLRDSADSDEALVRRWAAAAVPAWPVHIHKADMLSGNVQEAAREVRYAQMAQQAHQHGSQAVLVAHHQQDQAETVLLNLLRGAGPKGLAGMPIARPLQPNTDITLLRPLLNVSKSAIRAYAEAHQVPYRTDPTNESTAYRRNRIRHEVLPLLADITESAPARLADTAALMQAYVQQHWQPLIDARMNAGYTDTPTGGRLSLDVLQEAALVVRTQLCLELLARTLPDAPQTRSMAEEIAALVDAQVGRRVEVAVGTVWRTRTHLEVVADPPEMPTPQSIPLHEAAVSLSTGTLHVKRTSPPPEAVHLMPPHTAVMDANRLHPPVTVRPWHEGDRLRPLGMQGHVSVSDVLTNAHVPPHEKPYSLVVEDQKRIVWVVGQRLHHAVRITPETQRALVLHWHPNE